MAVRGDHAQELGWRAAADGCVAKSIEVVANLIDFFILEVAKFLVVHIEIALALLPLLHRVSEDKA